ncbi:hypothetical protein CDAR_271 [Caerostris darwini]|uniref:Uncharacterized protein n=1 Tax=Caerostris darwini TaxID=1538125 RepID=A0AAV4ULN6_9ARAC|nr:hypothetical protein CDAR_271 [Caerostris darwini]
MRLSLTDPDIEGSITFMMNHKSSPHKCPALLYTPHCDTQIDVMIFNYLSTKQTAGPGRQLAINTRGDLGPPLHSSQEIRSVIKMIRNLSSPI